MIALHDVRAMLATDPRVTDSAPLVAMIDAAGASPSGTMAAWMAAHAGQLVETLQLDVSDGALRSAWMPGPRRVTTSATFVRLDESRRYYRGCRVLAATPDALAIADGSTVAVYVAGPA